MMKRKVFMFFAAIAALLMAVPLPTWAYETLDYDGFTYHIHSYDDPYKYRGDGLELQGAVLVHTHDKTGEIRVPDKVFYNGKWVPVVGISGNDDTFCGHANITKIIIPGTVRCMENWSLGYVTDLEELVFEDGDEDLWMGYYYRQWQCNEELTYKSDKLKTVSIGRNMKWYTDEDEPFEDKYIENIIITPGCTHIGMPSGNRSLFNCCTDVKSIRIEDSPWPLEVDYKGLYMKSTAASRHQWEYVYVGREVHYPGWDKTDNTADADCYSPFYKLGNRNCNIYLGRWVSRLGSYMFYNSYVNDIICYPSRLTLNTKALANIETNYKIYLDKVIIDQEKVISPIKNARINDLIVEGSCENLEGGHHTDSFEDCDIENVYVEPASTPLGIQVCIFAYCNVQKLICHRDIKQFELEKYQDLCIKGEIIFGDECTKIYDYVLTNIPADHSPTIRIGKNVKSMSSIISSQRVGSAQKPSSTVYPTVIFEATSVYDLPEIRKPDEWNTGNLYDNKQSTDKGNVSYAGKVPTYFYCGINKSDLGSKWNGVYKKWHPQGNFAKGDTRDATTGLYSAACGVCRTPEANHWTIEKWNGTDNLYIEKDNNGYVYNDGITINDSKPFRIPVTLNPYRLYYKRKVNGGDIEGIILPFDVKSASYVNGSVYELNGYDAASAFVSFKKVADDAPLKACTPYFVVYKEDAAQMFNYLPSTLTIQPTINTDGTTKLFNVTKDGATFTGTFCDSNISNGYVYDAELKNYKKSPSGTAVLLPLRACMSLSGAPDVLNIKLIDENGKETILGNPLIPTLATVEGSEGNTYKNAFDGSAVTKWSGEMPESHPAIVWFKMMAPQNVISYYFYTGDDNQNGDRNPTSWTLYAKQDETDDTWKAISVVEDGKLPKTTMTKSDDYYLDIDMMQKKYQYFKLEINALEKGTAFELAEVHLNTDNMDAIIEVAGEEDTDNENGVHSGRVTSIDEVTVNGCTYALYKNYSYYPYYGSGRPKPQTSLKRTIEGYSCMLVSCDSEGELVIPSTVNFQIGSVSVPVPVKMLGENSLESSKVTSLVIPSSVELTERAALTCDSLRSVRFEDGNKLLYVFNANGDSELGRNKNLQDVYIGRVIESNYKDKGLLSDAFSPNFSVTFGDAVTAVMPNLCSNATGLQSLQLPISLRAVSESMCEGCTGLTSVEIPHRVQAIEKYAFSGCSNISDYLLRPSTPPTIQGTSFDGTTDYVIIIPSGTQDAYLTREDWTVYQPHIVITEHHTPCEPTPYERGFQQECWEHTFASKFYSDADCTVEIDGLDLAKNVTYAKLDVSPASSADMSEFTLVESDNKETWGVQLNWAAETTFADTYSTLYPAARYADFKVKEDAVDYARLVWMKNQGDYHQGKFTVTVYVNGEARYSINQDSNEYLEGVNVLPLPGLKKDDVVRFEVKQDAKATWKGAGPTFKAALEYTLMCSTLTANEDPDEPGVYYVTYYNGRSAYALSEGATAYTAAIDDEDNLLLTPIEDGIIAKGEAVVIRSGKSLVAITPVGDEKAKDPANMLRGTDTDMPAPNGCYIFTYAKNNGVGFYKYAAGKTLAAHKAFLYFNRETQANAFRMIFDGDATEGIDRVDGAASEDNAVYAVSGVRLSQPQSGINIVGGKKTVIK